MNSKQRYGFTQTLSQFLWKVLSWFRSNSWLWLLILRFFPFSWAAVALWPAVQKVGPLRSDWPESLEWFRSKFVLTVMVKRRESSPSGMMGYVMLLILSEEGLSSQSNRSSLNVSTFFSFLFFKVSVLVRLWVWIGSKNK